MITLYSGTPGSGKSLHVARDIYNRLNVNKKYPSVIATFDINGDMIKGKNSKFTYIDINGLNVKFLLNYAKKYHVLGKENQTLVIVDECQVIWNAREWQDKGERMEWIKFFTQHRHLGYNFIIISQNDRMIDRQIRSLVEYNVIHRKVNNFKIGKMLPFPTFVAITRWYGINEKLNSEFFTFRKKWGKFYDSYTEAKLENEFSHSVRKTERGRGFPSVFVPEKKKGLLTNILKSINIASYKARLNNKLALQPLETLHSENQEPSV